MTSRLLVAFVLTMASITTSAQQLAFPGAQGWGRFATGGRGGTVYHVTNLNDSGTGSLRDAVSQPNRIVVFDVAGIINIKSQLVFKSNITVAGQTAPGEGITVYGDGTSCSGASNVIIRYMRFRMGSGGSAEDCGGLSNGRNMIFDHCSFSWAKDENFSINWDNKGTMPQDITIQNCLIGQGLMQHSAGGLIQNCENITMYRNLLCDNKTRNFKVKGVHQYVNNIVYNWQSYAYEMGGESAGESFANVEGNLFINGPQTSSSANGFAGGNSDFHYYGNDNWQDRNKDGVFNPVLFTGTGGSNPVSTPYDYPELEKWAGNELTEKLLPEVGASLPYRDLADAYMVNEVLSFGTEGKLITKESELPIGMPTAWTMFTGTKPADTDGDGMPDAWETANGTNPSANDAMTIAANGYANIENYINSITREDRQFYLRAPMLPRLLSSTTISLTVGWSDFSDNEDGFIVEMESGGSFTEVGRTTANVSSFTITNADLTPGTAYPIRICAFSGNEVSGYATATVTTRPEQTEIVDAETFDGTGDGDWLIAPDEDETITLSLPTPKNTVVVRSDAHVTIDGSGYISGAASLNKTGNGTLTIASNQQYEGPTVLHKGTYEFSTLKDGGVASGLGKSMEFAQNWVMDGGTYRYTGGSTTTNRSALLTDDTELNIANSSAVVKMNGSIEGTGNLEIGGTGQLLVNNNAFFQFDGDVILSGGTLKLGSKDISEAGIGTASKLVLQGGTFTTVGMNESSISYNFPIEAVAGTTSTVDFDLWNTNKCRVSGTGTLIWNVHYLREYIEGNWDDFTGHLVINGTGKTNQSQFAVRNGTGVKNATIELKGTASITGGKNASTFYLGGLSGDAGTALSGFNVKAKGEGTWVVGGANTDEEFRGVIDDYDQAHSHPGKTSIVKEGSGYWRLTGNNTYSGTTNVKGGTLIVNGKHSGTGTVTVDAGATLAGTGTLAATVTLNGTLLVGDTKATDKGLTLSGGLKLGSNAKLRLNDAMLDETLYNGSTIQAFSGTATGTFANIIPATPGEGQTWDTSELYSKGILKVVGGEENPNTPDDPTPSSETKTALLAWGNMSNTSYDNSSYKNMMVGSENDEAYGFSMVITGNLAKSYSSAGTPKFKIPYNGETLERTGIVLSNGAQNTIFLPKDAKATKVTFYSVRTAATTTTRTSYWKEVAGVNYNETNSTLIDLNASRDNPNAISFALDNVQDKLTFTNTGEQQAVIVYLEYHYGDLAVVGDVTGDSKVDAADVSMFVSYLLGQSPAGFILKAADLTGDGKVDITDLTRLIAKIKN